MRLILGLWLLVMLVAAQPVFAEDELNKYAELCKKLEQLCKAKASENAFLKSIKELSDCHEFKGTRFAKAGAINFSDSVRLKILKDGNWDLLSEDRQDGLKIEHHRAKTEYDFFTFKSAKPVNPSELSISDHPVIVVFIPSKIIVITTDSDKLYYLIEDPDHHFAEKTYKHR